jgi:hypothetical protein
MSLGASRGEPSTCQRDTASWLIVLSHRVGLDKVVVPSATSLVNVVAFQRDAALILHALSPDLTLQSGHTISYILEDVVGSQRVH